MFETANEFALDLVYELQIAPYAPQLACNPTADCPNGRDSDTRELVGGSGGTMPDSRGN